MKRAGAILLFIALYSPARAVAQSAPTLTLDEAIAIALAQSRDVDRARLAEERAADDLAVSRSRRLPVFNTEAQVSRLMHPVDIGFPAGAFGVYPVIGPVPAVDSTITTPANTSMLFNASVTQPITGLIQAGLGVRMSETAQALAQEDRRAARLAVVRQVRRTYYAILQSASALEAAETNGRLLVELGRVVASRVAQRVALKADGLAMDTRLAQNELNVVTLRHAIASQKEQLNQLLGRDVSTDFQAVPVFDPAAASHEPAADLAANRPDVRQAHLLVQQAELAVRRARADRIPEVGLAFQSISPLNIDGAPRNIMTAGVQVKWEPFDWGRRSRTIAGKRTETLRAVDSLRDAQDRARLEINRYRRALEEAKVSLRVAGLNQSAAREQARVRATQYQAQAALLSDALQAQATLADSTNQYQQALLTLLTASADLDHALGEEPVR
jgi:outer membrane protein TolC